MQEVAIGYELYRITHDPLALALIGLVEALPFISFSLFGGHIAERTVNEKSFYGALPPSPSVQQSSSSFHENKTLSLQRSCCSLFTRRSSSSVSAERSSLPRRHPSADSSFPSNIMKTPQRGAVLPGKMGRSSGRCSPVSLCLDRVFQHTSRRRGSCRRRFLFVFKNRR